MPNPADSLDLSPGGDTFVQAKPFRRPFIPRTSCIYLVERSNNVLGLVLREKVTRYMYPIVALQNHPELLQHLESLRLLSALEGDGIDWADTASPLLKRVPFEAGIVIPWQSVHQCAGLVEAILDAPTCGGLVVERHISSQGVAKRAWIDLGIANVAASGSLQNVLSSVATLWNTARVTP